MITLGKKLKGLRKARKLTLKELSAELGLSVSYLSDLERGRTEPSLATCRKLCRSYKIKLATLFHGVE